MTILQKEDFFARDSLQICWCRCMVNVELSKKQAFAQAGRLNEAVHLFQQMPSRNVVSWNILITAYSQHGVMNEALSLFQHMPERDIVSWNALISACAQHGQLNEALQLFQQMPRRDIVSWTAVVVAYAHEGKLKEARQLFDTMPERDVVAWTAMISSYSQKGRVHEALQLFDQMPDRNVVSWTAIIEGFVQQGELDQAFQFFLKMPQRDAVSWTAMVSGYANMGLIGNAIELFQQMLLEGIHPDKAMLINLLDACARNTALTLGKWLHKLISDMRLDSDVIVQTALINMYSKCNNIREASTLFDKMVVRDIISWNAMLSAYAEQGNLSNSFQIFKQMPCRNTISWNAMVAAYTQHGRGKEVVNLIRQMHIEGVMLDEVTFCSILSACSRVGLVDEGSHYFLSLFGDHDVTPTLEQHNCVVDLLGRTECLGEAEAFIMNMPFEPSAASWTALLGSCRSVVDIERGMRAASCISSLEPDVSAPYILLSNIYAASVKESIS